MADIIDVIMRLTDQVTGPLRRIRGEMEQGARMHERLGGTISRVGGNISAIGSMMMPVAGAITAPCGRASGSRLPYIRIRGGCRYGQAGSRRL